MLHNGLPQTVAGKPLLTLDRVPVAHKLPSIGSLNIIIFGTIHELAMGAFQGCSGMLFGVAEGVFPARASGT